MEFFKLRQDDGVSYYYVPIGSNVYRGDTSVFVANDKPPMLQFRKYEYFAPKPQIAETYGIVSSFTTKRPLKLLALDQPDTFNNLYLNAPAKVQNAFDASFPSMGEKRNSDVTSDRVIADYICDIGYDGYATGPMPIEETKTGLFHAEMTICEPSTVIDFQSYKVYTDAQIAEKKLTHRTIMQKKERRAKRRFRSDNEGPSRQKPIALNLKF